MKALCKQLGFILILTKSRLMVFVLISVFVFCLTGISSAQVKSPKKSRSVIELTLFTGMTSDMFYWDGVRCLMSLSPLYFFEGFKDIYPDVPCYEIQADFGEMPYEDKNYGAVWGVIDKMLYLCEVEFRYSFLSEKEINKLFPDNEQYKKLEKLIGARFRKLTTYKNAQIPISPYGVIPATWVNGTFYIKRIREYETVRQWDALPCKRLVFKQGKLISVDDVWEMDTRHLRY